MSHDPRADFLTLHERVREAITLGESHFREFKSALHGAPGEKRPRAARDVARDIGEVLVAFANADGGELLIGVEDSGDVTGIPMELDIDVLLRAPVTHIHPETPIDKPLSAVLETRDGRVLYLSVDKSTTRIHLTADGRCLQRRDREIVPVAFEKIHFERQEQHSREYDRGYVDGATLADIDVPLVERVTESISPGISAEKALQYLGLADFASGRLRLRRAALLLFGADIRRWHPRCQVRVLRVNGTEVKTGRGYNVVRDDLVEGNVLQLLQLSWEKLRPHLVQTKLTEEGRFLEQVMYPEDACREALINAIAHRDYSVEGQAIEVLAFDDRIDVRSPGGVLSTVSLDALRSGSGVHESRNTRIARVLRELGYMREMGEGVRRIIALMAASDLQPPTFASDAATFRVELTHRSVFSEEDSRWLRALAPFNLSRDEMLVVLLGKDGTLISAQQVFDALDLVDTEAYRAIVADLQLKGLLVTEVPRDAATAQRRKRGLAARQVPRFRVRSAAEALRDLAELQEAVAAVKPSPAVSRDELTRILERVSATSHFARASVPLRKALRALGLVSAGRATRTQTAEPGPEAPSSDAPARPPAPAEVLDDLFVGNLPADVLEGELAAVLTQALGPVVEVRMPRHPVAGGNRGFAFVKLATPVPRERLDTTVPLRGRALSLGPVRDPLRPRANRA